ncbi:MAG: hypothetical protein D6758_07170 [Gammaproteobacteria bacterium]|nr:MAG: hypothetical protein D6758_07170 [Gammaproteobacteria bacterium]
MRRITLISLIVMSGALAAGGVRLIQAKKAEEAHIPPAASYALVVPSQIARSQHVELTLPYLAEVQTDSDIRIASKVTARVLMILPVGTTVHEGDVIARLDASDLKARRAALQQQIEGINNQIRAQKASLDALIKTHERNTRLLAINAISRDRYDTEAARIEALRANLDASKSKTEELREKIREVDDTLTYTDIRAPMGGVISATTVNNGSTATAGQPLLTLSGGDQRRLVVRVPHEQRPKQLIWEDETCSLTPLGTTYHGLDEYSCAVRTLVPAGNRVEVSLVVYSGDSLLLPHDAVLAINGRHEVLVLEGDQARPVPVTIEAEGVEGYATQSLRPGTRYLVAKPDILLQAKAGVRIHTASPDA